MNVTVEFNTIARDSRQSARVGTLHDVDLDQAISMSTAMQGNPDVEAVIAVEDDREPSRLERLVGRMGTAPSC